MASPAWQNLGSASPFRGTFAGEGFSGNPEFSREHNILTPRFPWIRTLTNHNGVFEIGGPKALLFYRPDSVFTNPTMATLIPRKYMPASISDRSVTQITPIFDSPVGFDYRAFTGLILAVRVRG